MNSETVQAAQRLLAELAEVAQSAFITSESCGATAEYRHVFKFRTLAELQAFGRAWAAVVSMQPTPVTDFNLYTSPAPAPEDAERAAYLERWKDAPEWARWLTQDGHRWCVWHERQPHQQGSFWRPENADKLIGAGHNLLGAVRCEPRPQPAEDPERAAYLARWDGAPEWANWLAEDEDGECGWYGSKPSRGACSWHAQPVSSYCRAGDFMLRSFLCEPRPVQAVGP